MQEAVIKDPPFSALLLGGANSGKTACSLAWARKIGTKIAKTQTKFQEEKHPEEKPLYLATAALPKDKTSKNYALWQERIARHRVERGTDFDTLEEPAPDALVPSLEAARANVIVVDCLTLFLSALLFSEGTERMEQGKQAPLFERMTCELEDALPRILESGKSLVFVSNEVGLGVVPYTKMGDVFRGYAGILHQRVAARVSTLALVVAGVPMLVKGSLP